MLGVMDSRAARPRTYMYVRFVLKGDTEEDRLGQRATTVAGRPLDAPDRYVMTDRPKGRV